MLHDILAGDAGVFAIVKDRVYDRIVPARTADPYVVFQRISIIPEHTLNGEADEMATVFQIECWGKDPDEVERLALAVVKAMAYVDSFREAMSDGHEPAIEGSDAHDYVTRMDYELLHEVNA